MKLTKAQRQELRGKFDGRCAYCGEPLGERWHADHFEPIVRDWWSKTRGTPSRGPDHPHRDTLENMMPACAPCNIDKHANTLEGWRTKLSNTLRVLADNHATYRHGLRFGLIEEKPAPIVFYFEKIGPAVTPQKEE